MTPVARWLLVGSFVLLSGCALIRLPFQILGSLISAVVRNVPKIAALVMVSDEEAAPAFEEWMRDRGIDYRELTPRQLEAGSALASNAPSDPDTTRLAVAELLEELTERARDGARSAPVESLFFLRPGPAGAGIDPRLSARAQRAGASGRRSFLVLSPCQPGEESARSRRELVTTLRRSGVEVVDWTPHPQSTVWSGDLVVSPAGGMLPAAR